MMPLLLFTLGRFFIDTSSVVIPYGAIALQLLQVVIPVIAGLLLSHFRPKWAAIIRRLTCPLALVFLLVILCFATYVNLPIYRMIGQYPILIPLGCGLPWCGFLFSGLLAWLCCQDWPRILTISIEAGIQNILIAMLVLNYTMPQPDGDLGSIMPIMVAIFTPIPLYLALLVKSVRERRLPCCRKKQIDEAGDGQKPGRLVAVNQPEPEVTPPHGRTPLGRPTCTC
ncbi:unnamed protein product [Protopolystoma xenopodis]|uniref:Uncharacterized protein n=1 Tax=Protopolystoma xenopodis TaxID=117903 RepID=A0A448X5H1_9PLAT|nr:unnamed protein product [Protopolystoma xenopodis]